ncbi:MAG: septum formation initiator family protein [Salinisphaeraceae bacterium]|uniref:Cell division protein FtsB n=2 Tax=Spectribacter TaxID=3160928 RepID=A0ABU3C1E0_9GAMM|nr:MULTISPECIES: septum formation initiator family protein [unclassified Salinisphaera]MDT0617342.1 septum formation initiator family protein [Salinisphaera sp. P385]MDT0635371.1 septum formation initiator family protein [Salinisphaera sp. W335]
MDRIAIIALCLLIAGLQFRLWVGDGGYADTHRLSQEIETLAGENEVLRARNDAMAAEIAELDDGGKAMEGRARSDLGMIKQGEQFYLVIDRR